MPNRDELVGLNMPRAGYALSGAIWSNETDEKRGAPMIINSHTPGTFADDWINTYGASHDSFLSIVDGADIEASIDAVSLNGVYRALPNTADDNIWELVGSSQQIQYIVSGRDIEEGRGAVDNFGALPDARGLCIRLPMMARGYGKTKEMLPLSGTGRQNPDSIKLNTEFWNTGSVDMRWDEKRKVWGGFNDLIVDHEGASLGTAVFSTNPDASEGFPWLKGRLEDVWWVRQPTPLDGTSGKTDGATTAEVMTHLEHQWFDKEEDGSAKLSSIFIIPHKNLDPEGTPDVPHDRGAENILGTETTGVGASIDLRSSVHFYKEKTMDGPIKMERKISDIADIICCDNGASKLFIGEMIFLDQQPGLCDDVVPPVDVPNKWVPAVRVDECHLVGGHFGGLVSNDIAIMQQVGAVCIAMNKWSKELQDEINDIANALGEGTICASDNTAAVAAATQKGFADFGQQVAKAIVAAGAAALVPQLNAFKTAVADALFSCCEVALEFDFTAPGKLPKFEVPKILSGGCFVEFGKTSEFPCDVCRKVGIQAPCANNDGPFLAGSTCGGTSARGATPDYSDVGDCQT